MSLTAVTIASLEQGVNHLDVQYQHQLKLVGQMRQTLCMLKQHLNPPVHTPHTIVSHPCRTIGCKNSIQAPAGVTTTSVYLCDSCLERIHIRTQPRTAGERAVAMTLANMSLG